MKLFLTILLSLLLGGCATAKVKPLDVEVMADFDWRHLTFDQRVTLYEKFAAREFWGAGVFAMEADGSWNFDTSKKAEVALEYADKILDKVADGAKTAWSGVR